MLETDHPRRPCDPVSYDDPDPLSSRDNYLTSFRYNFFLSERLTGIWDREVFFISGHVLLSTSALHKEFYYNYLLLEIVLQSKT